MSDPPHKETPRTLIRNIISAAKNEASRLTGETGPTPGRRSTRKRKSLAAGNATPLIDKPSPARKSLRRSGRLRTPSAASIAPSGRRSASRSRMRGEEAEEEDVTMITRYDEEDITTTQLLPQSSGQSSIEIASGVIRGGDQSNNDTSSGYAAVSIQTSRKNIGAPVGDLDLETPRTNIRAVINDLRGVADSSTTSRGDENGSVAKARRGRGVSTSFATPMPLSKTAGGGVEANLVGKDPSEPTPRTSIRNVLQAGILMQATPPAPAVEVVRGESKMPSVTEEEGEKETERVTLNERRRVSEASEAELQLEYDNNEEGGLDGYDIGSYDDNGSELHLGEDDEDYTDTYQVKLNESRDEQANHRETDGDEVAKQGADINNENFAGLINTLDVAVAAVGAKKNPPTAQKKAPKKKTELGKVFVHNSFQGFSKLRVNFKDASPMVMKASDAFFKQLADDLSAYSRHAGRASVGMSDVELLMRRQRILNEKTSLSGLMHSFLSTEQSQKVLPIARKKNTIVP
eukprot:Nk52_evm52s224 gene=Nk52_evmTU52s224